MTMNVWFRGYAWLGGSLTVIIPSAELRARCTELVDLKHAELARQDLLRVFLMLPSLKVVTGQISVYFAKLGANK